MAPASPRYGLRMVSQEGSPARSVGPWLLGARLGKGGNAVVYEATDSRSGGRVALKVLTASRPAAEPYRRFQREISTLRQLGAVAGVLPLIDAHLPTSPTKVDPAWLAMPIATPVASVLSGAPLERVVTGIAAIAETLSRLAALGISHRDIKPGNLYVRDKEWLVGDFGLVDVPNVESITRGDRPLGPLHFTPSEVLVSHAEIDWSRVDVYALAKTIWVLATDQRHPPDGHQPANVHGLRLSEYVKHPHAGVLDRLVDRATSIAPSERPSMGELASELGEWLALPTDDVAIDVGLTAQRIRERLAREISDSDRRDQWREAFRAAARDLQRLTRPLNEILKEILGRAEIDRADDTFARNVLTTRRYGGSPDIVNTYLRTSRISAGLDHSQLQLSMSRCLELTDAGLLIMRLMLSVSRANLGGGHYEWRTPEASEPVTSVAASAMLESGVRELRIHLPDALRAFEESLPEEA